MAMGWVRASSEGPGAWVEGVTEWDDLDDMFSLSYLNGDISLKFSHWKIFN